MFEADIILEEIEKKIKEDQRILKQQNYHRKTVWVYFVNVVLGAWLIASPLTFRYENVSLIYSDIISGVLLIIFSIYSLNPFKFWAPWASIFIGLWLNVAPLVFWAPTDIAYNNDTIVGILILAFAFVIPGMPGMKYYEKEGPSIPLGWSYNPSSWLQRIPVITLGWIGFFTSRYLASYQLGYLNSAWDPFFIDGTENVLNSSVSKAWPVSDAGLGAFSYMLDVMMGYLGGENRWRTMPWLVIFFGILVIPLGAVSIILIILQPLVVGAWCSICLFTAVVMLFMIPVTFDEILASIQFLSHSKKEGKSVWKTFLLGGSYKIITKDTYKPHDFASPFGHTLRAMFSGFIIPWNLILCVFLGIWIIFSPTIFSYNNSAMADSDHLVGALIITFSVIAIGEIVRVIRFINIFLGLWLMLAPFFLKGSIEIALSNGLICGFLLILLSIRKGPIKDKYGNFDKYIV